MPTVFGSYGIYSIRVARDYQLMAAEAAWRVRSAEATMTAKPVVNLTNSMKNGRILFLRLFICCNCV